MKVILSLILSTPLLAIADDISMYQYYANNGSYMAYIKKSDHCVYGGFVKENDIHKYCIMGTSNLDLKNNFPTIHATDLLLSGTRLSFFVAAPWNEQKCEIDLNDNLITCEPTGK